MSRISVDMSSRMEGWPGEGGLWEDGESGLATMLAHISYWCGPTAVLEANRQWGNM